MKKIFTVILMFFLCAAFIGCGKEEAAVSGKTMGTTYHIKVVKGSFDSVANLQEEIDERLAQINKSMSTYQKESEINQFNRMARVGEAFKASDDFYRVMSLGRQLHALTSGAWDGTVDPLVKLWGFGNRGSSNRIPEKSEIESVLQNVGFDQIDISEDKKITKKKPVLGVDLASVAKGYGVDQIAQLLRDKGFEDFIVEIGGEVFASGLRMDGGMWRVGINIPEKDAPADAVYKVVAMSNKGFATSGDYRNFFEIDGRSYSHVLDPRTGYPVSNGVVSASVLASDCAFADGLATALMIMGPKKGLSLVARLKGVECFIVVRDADGNLTNHASDGFSTVD